LNLGVRYSYFPSPRDTNNTLVNFDPLLYNPANAPTGFNADGSVSTVGYDAATYANGLILPTGGACTAAQAIPAQFVTCSPYGSAVNANSNKNFGPRIGLAYDPFGNGKWAVRAGYGIFYDRTLNGIWEQNAFDDPPLVQTTTKNNPTSANLFDNPTNGATAPIPNTPTFLVTTGSGNSPVFKVPSYQDYNLSVQHEVLPNTVLEVGFVGTRGNHLLGDLDINQPTVASRLANPTSDVNAIRPYLGYGIIADRSTIYTSNYNSLQISANRRFSKGLTFGLSYTWSKLLTTNPQDRDLSAYDTYDLKQSYGASTLNTPQMLAISYVYDLPYHANHNGLMSYVLGGWELSGIISVQTGQSQILTQNNDPWSAAGYPGGLGMNRPYGASTYLIRPEQISSNVGGPKSVVEYFNTAAFTDAVAQFGSARPGAVLGPGFQIWDTSLFKNFHLGERVGLQLRLETFNTFNHGNPSSIQTDVDNTPLGVPGAFGSVTAWHDPRIVQLGGKITF
jgi:hypothetical protein